MIDRILLTTPRIYTFVGNTQLTNATGFFFARNDRLFLATSRHVLIDKPSSHYPDRIEIDLHVDENNLAHCVRYSLNLYSQGQSLWRQGEDSGGEIDVALIEVNKSYLPVEAIYASFGVADLQPVDVPVEVGTPLLIVGFPLGFHDTLHHMPVVRGAVLASSYGLRFQGQGYFLSDGRTHRGSSGAPVILRKSEKNGDANETMPWILLGVHSARLDMGSRDIEVDEALGLNCAWYADILLTLSEA